MGWVRSSRHPGRLDCRGRVRLGTVRPGWTICALPRGVPQDPYARPIPMYPGTPGGAVGEPIRPRGAVPEPLVVPPLPRDIPQTSPLYPRFVPLTLAQCGTPWSRATKLTPTEFRRRCASMLKHQEELKRREEGRSIHE